MTRRTALLRVLTATVLLETGVATAGRADYCLRCILFGGDAVCIDDFFGGHGCAYENNGAWCIQFGTECAYTIATPVMRVFLADGTASSDMQKSFEPNTAQRGCGGVLLNRAYSREVGERVREATRLIVL